MKRLGWPLCLVALVTLACSFAVGQSKPVPIRVIVQGDSSRLPNFVESCRREFAERGMKLELVRPDEDYDYNVVIAQETSIGGAASAVVALDRKGLFVASVVRSGRWSGKGALNATAKELAKKIAILRGLPQT